MISKAKTNNKIELVVIHCSATPNGKAFTAKDIHQMHLNRGFAGIGYHKVILIDGTVEMGRPEYWTGAHVSGYNDDSLGICLIGTDRFSEEQFEALSLELKTYRRKYGANLKITGHRDLSPDLNKDGKITKNEWIKLCPGFDVAEYLKISRL
jgi:N-acetylmuramoyl-L-alanine amidase